MRERIRVPIGGGVERRPCRVRSHVALLLGLVFAAATILAPSAGAQTTRVEQSSFASAAGAQVAAMAVDQSTGDVYVADRVKHVVLRFDSNGAPDDFTAGADAGSNTLTGFQSSLGSDGPQGIAVDNSGGPLDGDFYVIDGGLVGGVNTSTIKVFARSGALLGQITEAGAAPSGPELEEEPNLPHNRLYNPCGVAVDQSDGSLYVAERYGFGGSDGHIWRYSPSSPSGTIDRGDYVLTGVQTEQPCGLAADAGHVYTIQFGSVRRFEASAFTVAFPRAEGAEVAANAFGVGVDRGDGDVYVDEGFQVAVYDQAGAFRYRFSRPGEIGARSAAVAVKSAVSGAAPTAYVTDGDEGRVHVYGSVTQVQRYVLPELGAFGPDATSASSFKGEIRQAALQEPARALYFLSNLPAGIFGFDVSAFPSLAVLAGFDPLSAQEPGSNDGLAVDNSGGASEGNIYFASQRAGVVHGFDASGNPLGGNFPIDPEASPGAPAGSPKEVCGVGVDPAGRIWVANGATKRILEYGSDGASLGVTVDASAVAGPCRLAFDGEGNLYVGSVREGSSGGVWRFTAASGYATATQIDTRLVSQIAADHAHGRVFAAHSIPLFGSSRSVTWIDEYDEAGKFLDEYLDEAGAALEGIAVEETSRDVYAADMERRQVRAFGPPVVLPEVDARAASAIANNTATLNGTVGLQQVALTGCRFEYVSEEAFRVSGFSNLSSGGSVACAQSPGSIPVDFEAHAVSADVSGLSGYTGYRFRLVAENAQGSLASGPEGFVTASPPAVEVAGAPDRSATTAVLNGRVNPRNAATTFHFEYGSEGPCSEDPCASTPDRQAGSGNEIELVAGEIEGLKANTTYHYRLIADNGDSAGPAVSPEMTVTTQASDSILSHGNFPGPPGSDRAYEQVSLPDSGGNPVNYAVGFSEDGDSALYSINGGTPISDNGTVADFLFSERTAEGWRSKQITPPRSLTIATDWELRPTSDLKTILAANSAFGGEKVENMAVWQLSPSGEPHEMLRTPPEVHDPLLGLSADGRREIVNVEAPVDPAYPGVGGVGDLYDVGSSPARLVSVLPGNLPGCVIAENMPSQSTADWISADGSRVYFPSKGTAPSCSGPTELYMRDVEAGQSTLLSGPVLSGPDCGGVLIRAVEGAVFFWSQSRLVANDTPAGACGGDSPQDGDVYRYDLNNQALTCLTCVVRGRDANVYAGSQPSPASRVPLDVGVAPDGSRVYFKTTTRLAADAQPEGQFGAYVLEVESGALSYVGPIGSSQVGQTSGGGNALSSDGSVLVFRSNSAKLNPIGGVGGNGGQYQYYRYDDRDRSLICISCTPDGSSVEGVPFALTQGDDAALSMTGASADGSTIAFITANPLVGADQNTPGKGGNPASGQDVYEWRDGRLLLVTDGLTQWPATSSSIEGPRLSGISRSGRDVYFTVPAQYTPDALDGYRRLYDARVGGGIEFPKPPVPCALEVCQGVPKGAPLEQAPGTATFSGPGNVEPVQAKPRRATLRCAKAKRLVRKRGKPRCVSTRHKKKRGGARHRSNRKGRSGK